MTVIKNHSERLVYAAVDYRRRIMQRAFVDQNREPGNALDFRECRTTLREIARVTHLSTEIVEIALHRLVAARLIHAERDDGTHTFVVHTDNLAELERLATIAQGLDHVPRESLRSLRSRKAAQRQVSRETTAPKPVADPYESCRTISRKLSRQSPKPVAINKEITNPSNKCSRQTSTQSSTDRVPRSASTEIGKSFGVWWAAYPKKIGKRVARREFVYALAGLVREKGSRDEALAFMIERVEAFAKTPVGQHSQECPRPESWLRDGRWDDDPAEWEVTIKPCPKAREKSSQSALAKLRAQYADRNSNEVSTGDVKATSPQIPQKACDGRPIADGRCGASVPGSTIELDNVLKDAVPEVCHLGVTAPKRKRGESDEMSAAVGAELKAAVIRALEEAV
ncbi:MAG: hypothetical protein MPJ50_11065 [Pirellulales bacterium]|nr:hypothetical protein [Pirellulales bacterium]